MTVKKFYAVFLSFFLITPYLYSGAFEDDVNSSLSDLNRENVSIPVPSKNISPKVKAPKIDIFKYFDRALGKKIEPRPFVLMPSKSVSVSKPLVTFKISAIKNKYLKTKIGFKTRKGRFVHVGGAKASNCPGGGTNCAETDKYFLVLTVDGGGQFIIKGKDIANASIFMRGSKTVSIDGDKYTAKLYVKITSPKDSVLEIKSGGKTVVKANLTKLGEAVSDAAETVMLDKTYKLSCGYELIQNKKGAKFTDKLLIFLVPFPVTDSTYFALDVNDMRGEGTTYPSFNSHFGFKVNGDILEIFRI